MHTTGGREQRDKENAIQLNLFKAAGLQTQVFKADDVFEADFSTEQRKDLQQYLQKHCPAPDKVELAVGVRGMLVKTLNVAEGLTNGMLLTVTSLAGDKTVEAQLETVSGEITTTIGFAEFPLGRQDRVLAVRNALPIILAWACTVSKVQGLTLQAVAVHVDGLSFEGQLYTALSRVGEWARLRVIGTRLNIRVNREALAFHQSVSQCSAARSALRQQPALPPAAASLDSAAHHAGPATMRIRRPPLQGDSVFYTSRVTGTGRSAAVPRGVLPVMQRCPARRAQVPRPVLSVMHRFRHRSVQQNHAA